MGALVAGGAGAAVYNLLSKKKDKGEAPPPAVAQGQAVAEVAKKEPRKRQPVKKVSSVLSKDSTGM